LIFFYFNQHFVDFGEALIIDNGSGMIKIGLANQETPKHIPNFIGTANYQVHKVIIVFFSIHSRTGFVHCFITHQLG